MTRHGSKQFVSHRFNPVTLTMLDQIRQYITHQLFGIRTTQQRGYLPHRQGLRANALDLQTKLLQFFTVGLGQGRLFLTDGQR